VTNIIPNNATSAVLTWTGLPQYLPPGSAGGYGFRFRISSDQQAMQNATGYAPDGEVEDYFVPSSALCSMSMTISPDQAICPGQPAQLQATGGVTYTWLPTTGLSNASTSNPTASPSATTLYTATASNPQGCSAQASVTVNVISSPLAVTISGQNAICFSKSVTLSAAGATNYSWSAAGQGIIGSGPSITASPQDSTTYYVTGTTYGCTGVDSITVAVVPLPVFTANASQSYVCKNDSTVLTASGGDQYAWSSADGQPLGSTPWITILPDTNSDYQVQIIDTLCQMTSTLTVPITVKPTPVLQVTSSNDINCSIGQATLQATGGTSYQWSPRNDISDPTMADPVVSPPATTTYYVKGTDPNGCSSVDSVTVKVNHQEDLSRYPVPNAFSPNNDGHDDCFGLKYWGQVSSLELAIYNRWGQLLFMTTDPHGCWDGTYKGIPQPAGGYVYEIKATTACGIAYRKGIVILVR
jgi:gliding motility-associated-like protein